jgi:glycosyltransferase involved in cell wall biosynthesis
MTISVVIPVHNEAGNLAILHEELQKQGVALSQIIYVDDGSTDGSLAELKNLRGATIIVLNRRWGQAAALDAGFQAVSGELIVSLDADGQNDPADIPRLISALEETGADVVAGWRQNRQDSQRIKLISGIGRWVRRLLVNDGITDAGCTLRVYKRSAAHSLTLTGDMHRWIIPLLRWKGFTIAELPVNHRPRRGGQSKYSSGKAVVGFFDLLSVWFVYKYADRPIHFFGWLSLGSFVVGIASAIWTIYQKVAAHISFNHNGWFFLAIFFLLSAILFFSFGLILDFLIRLSLDVSPRQKPYYVRETITV